MSKKKNDDLNITQEDLKKFGQEHIQKYKDELSVLESIDKAEGYVVLPMSVHNLSVIMPMQSYQFLRPIYDLYASIDLRIHKDEEFKKTIRAMKERLYKLVHEEDESFRKQSDMAVIEARKKNKTINLKDESAYFEHVVYDPSRELQYFIMLITRGLHITDFQKDVIDRLNTSVHKLCKDRIIITKKAIENCEILAR